jgi:hypothetical protein
MNDPERDEPQIVSRSNALAAAAVAIAVCIALMGLFVWQPWSPIAPPVHPASADAR